MNECKKLWWRVLILMLTARVGSLPGSGMWNYLLSVTRRPSNIDFTQQKLCSWNGPETKRILVICKCWTDLDAFPVLPHEFTPNLWIWIAVIPSLSLLYAHHTHTVEICVICHFVSFIIWLQLDEIWVIRLFKLNSRILKGFKLSGSNRLCSCSSF